MLAKIVWDMIPFLCFFDKTKIELHQRKSDNKGNFEKISENT